MTKITTIAQLKSLVNNKEDPSVYVIPLGGCGEFGMNLTLYVCKSNVFVVDAGVLFAEDKCLGIDALIPDLNEIMDCLGGVDAYFITHGHEDHLGALPYLLERWPAPTYMTLWTSALLKRKLERHTNKIKPVIHVVQPGDKVKAKNIEVTYMLVNHSIPMACSLGITLGEHKIIHTGDFKIGKGDTFEPELDIEKFKNYSQKGVDAILTDSTNAHKEGFCPPETIVSFNLQTIFNHSKSAVFVTTFSSNLSRIHSVVDACIKSKKRLYVAGTGLLITLGIAEDLKVWQAPDGLLVSDAELKNIKREDLVVLVTGCQGEYRAALNRIVNDNHKFIKLEEGDTVVFSSRIIPGNEKGIIGIKNKIMERNAIICTDELHPGIHVSGHAYKEDLSTVINATNPKYYVPVHGTYFNQFANHSIVSSKKGEEFSPIVKNGQILKFKKHKMTHMGSFSVGYEYIEQDSRVVIDQVTLRKRHLIGSVGLCLVRGVYSLKKNTWLKKASIEFIGFSFSLSIDVDKFKVNILNEIKKQSKSYVDSEERITNSDQSEMSEKCRVAVRRMLFKALRKKPVVMVMFDFVK